MIALGDVPADLHESIPVSEEGVVAIQSLSRGTSSIRRVMIAHFRKR
jgi:hypothetical protein